MLQDSNHVSAFILARLNGTISLQLHRANEYANYGFGSLTDTAKNAEKLAVQFMLLDFKTFGHDRFNIFDNRLLNDLNLPFGTIVRNKTVHISEREPQQSRTSGYEVWTYDVCTSYLYLDCTTNHSCCPDGSCGACQELCWKQGSICEQVSILVYVDYGNWNTGGSGTIGGGGGSDGVVPPGYYVCNPNPYIDNGYPPCSTGGTNGWSSYLAAQLVDVDKSEIVDPCLKAVIDNISRSGLSNFISKTYDEHSSTPTNTHKYKVKYTIDNNLIDDNGLAIPGNTNVTTGLDGTHEVSIILNPSLFQNSSKEWVTAVILHELMHGILAVLRPQDNNNQLAHKTMFNSKTPLLIREALKEFYPSLDDHDAIALGMDGLGLPLIFMIPDPNNPSQQILDPVKNQFSLDNYFQSISQALTAIIPYRHGTAGTPFC